MRATACGCMSYHVCAQSDSIEQGMPVDFQQLGTVVIDRAADGGFTPTDRDESAFKLLVTFSIAECPS